MLMSQMPSLEVVRSCFRLIAKGAVFAHSASQGQGQSSHSKSSWSENDRENVLSESIAKCN